MRRKSASTGDVGVNQPWWIKEEKKKSYGQDGEAWEGQVMVNLVSRFKCVQGTGIARSSFVDCTDFIK